MNDKENNMPVIRKVIKISVILYLGFSVTFCYADLTPKTYVLKTGAEASKRLEMQSSFLINSEHFLIESGLGEGKVVYDVGCGNGLMTEKICKTVGEKGHVYAVDSSSKQLSEAKKRVEEAGCSNVTFVQANVEEIEEFEGKKADVLYARYFLMHLRDPKKTIKKMKNHLNTHGVLVLEEPINSSFFTPENQGYMEDYLHTALKVGKEKGLDYDFGLHLLKYVKESGFVDITEEQFTPLIQPDVMREYMNHLLTETKDSYIKLGAATEEDYNKWQQEANQVKIPVHFPTIVSVRARL